MGKSGVRSVEPRGADLVVRALRNAGTRHVFSLSGNQIMPIYDALVDGDINLYHVRQEAAAVHMADAWGRLTGSPGVALVTAGTGVRQHAVRSLRGADGGVSGRAYFG